MKPSERMRQQMAKRKANAVNRTQTKVPVVTARGGRR